MATCIHCGSNRIVQFAGRSKDYSTVSIPHLDIENEGYSVTPTFEPGIWDDCFNDTDYVAFSYCLDCLKVQTTYQPTDDEIINDLVAS
jgi:hypothetical protein